MWRFSLEDSRTGKRLGFADLEALMGALEEELVREQDELSGWRSGLR